MFGSSSLQQSETAGVSLGSGVGNTTEHKRVLGLVFIRSDNWFLTYFGVDVTGSRHLWRQQFPDGQPEQITFGPTEEDGVAVAPDGRSLITFVGTRQSALWIHDGRGDRPLSSQGYVSHPASTTMSGTIPVFSKDGKSLFYLRSESSGGPTELWRADVASEKNERALPGIRMTEFDLSDDAKEVLYSVHPSGTRCIHRASLHSSG